MEERITIGNIETELKKGNSYILDNVELIPNFSNVNEGYKVYIMPGGLKLGFIKKTIGQHGGH